MKSFFLVSFYCIILYLYEDIADFYNTILKEKSLIYFILLNYKNFMIIKICVKVLK